MIVAPTWSVAVAGFRLPYKCVDKSGAETQFIVENNDEYYLTAVIRTLGMHSVEEYEASGLDCRKLYEWAHNITPLGTAPLKPGYSSQVHEWEKKPAPAPVTAPKTGPFTRFALGGYFDAIYNGDIETIRKLDKELVGKQVAQVQAQFKAFGAFGQKLSSMIDADKASLVNTAVRAYLFAYGGTYSKCLRKDAATFTETSTNVYTGKIKTGQTFVVNREFVDAFNGTYSEASLTDLTEPLLSIANGTAQIMAAYPCTDPVIKRYEAELLQMYNQIRSR